MKQIKRFIDCYIPTETCNLRCHYCYITQKKRFHQQLFHLNRPVEEMKEAFSQEKWGGSCIINLCAGGETLLAEEVVDVASAMIEAGHYVMIVTNGTVSGRFEQISCLPERIRRNLFIKFSFHYLELLRLGWLEKFCENVLKMKQAGISFTIEATPSDELIPYIEELKAFCIENFGALCHVTIARNDRTEGIDILSKMSLEEYQNTWKGFQSELFEMKCNVLRNFYRGGVFCYAGIGSVYLDLMSGDYKQCYCGQTLGNIYQDSVLAFRAIGKRCSFPYCYNGHAFLCFGDIPAYAAPTYDRMRNRQCADGTEWLTEEMKSVMQQKVIGKDDLLKKREIIQDTVCYGKELMTSKIKQVVRRLIHHETE